MHFSLSEFPLLSSVVYRISAMQLHKAAYFPECLEKPNSPLRVITLWASLVLQNLLLICDCLSTQWLTSMML